MLMRFQMGVMRSRRILEPFAGGFGCSRADGFSCNSFFATSTAGSTVLSMARITAITAHFRWKGVSIFGTVNP